MNEAIRILCVEDLEDDLILTLRVLKKAGMEVISERVDTLSAFKAALERDKWDVILSDYHLPEMTTLDALRQMKALGFDLPFIVVSGTVGEETAVALMRAGAHDYVMKDNLLRLPQVIKREMGEAKVRAEQRKAALALAQSEMKLQQEIEKLDVVVRHLPEGICLFDGDGQFVFGNELGKTFLQGVAVQTDEKTSHIDGFSFHELCAITKDMPRQIVVSNVSGRVLDIVVRPTTKTGPAGGWVVVFRDVTYEIQATEQAQHQDRLASIGQLASGIAHDFNNMLTVMNGFAQILEMNPTLDAQTKEDLALINQQGQRGAALVRQILDFSRETDAEKQPLDITPFLKETVKLFQRTFPETIDVIEALSSGTHSVLANITQLQQIVHNLAVNARDAMPTGGTLTFAAQPLDIAPHALPPVVGMKAGAWLKLTVTDTGSGMPPDVLKRVFEPFFTTKKSGEGTGLGLAQVYGLVSKHDGFVNIESAVGQGTTISLYFPLEESDTPGKSLPIDMPHGQGECILVVEDNDSVLQSVKKMLTHLNYEVLIAESVDEALKIVFEENKQVDAIVSDLVMPHRGGLDLFDLLHARGKTIPMSIMTGYPSEANRFKVQLQNLGGVILKPIEVSEVAHQVHTMLHPKSA